MFVCNQEWLFIYLYIDASETLPHESRRGHENTATDLTKSLIVIIWWFLPLFLLLHCFFFPHLFIGTQHNSPLVSDLTPLFLFLIKTKEKKLPFILDIVLLCLFTMKSCCDHLKWPCATPVWFQPWWLPHRKNLKDQTPTNQQPLWLCCVRVCLAGGKKSRLFSFFSTLLHFLSKWVIWDLLLIMRLVIYRKVAAPIHFVTSP